MYFIGGYCEYCIFLGIRSFILNLHVFMTIQTHTQILHKLKAVLALSVEVWDGTIHSIRTHAGLLFYEKEVEVIRLLNLCTVLKFHGSSLSLVLQLTGHTHCSKFSFHLFLFNTYQWTIPAFWYDILTFLNSGLCFLASATGASAHLQILRQRLDLYLT